MFEPIRNPHHHNLRKTRTPIIEQVRGRDIEILNAYERIVGNIRYMLSKLASREQQKFVEFAHPWQLSNQSVTKEFVCAYCSVQLYLQSDSYIIELITSPNTFNNGQGINSTSLLRMAFKQTADENTKLFIENCLKITLNDNPAAYFIKKQEQHETIMQAAYRDWEEKKKQGL